MGFCRPVARFELFLDLSIYVIPSCQYGSAEIPVWGEWLGTTGILAALRRRAIEGGGFRVVVSLSRTVLWLLSLGIFDKA